MQTPLPAYAPPNQRRAALAAGTAPALLLLTLLAVLVKWIELDLACAIFAVCTTWVVYEMHVYQATVDAYNEDYVGLHLAWRSAQALHSLIEHHGTSADTSVFVSGFVAARAALLHEGPLLNGQLLEGNLLDRPPHDASLRDHQLG